MTTLQWQEKSEPRKRFFRMGSSVGRVADEFAKLVPSQATQAKWFWHRIDSVADMVREDQEEVLLSIKLMRQAIAYRAVTQEEVMRYIRLGGWGWPVNYRQLVKEIRCIY